MVSGQSPSNSMTDKQVRMSSPDARVSANLCTAESELQDSIHDMDIEIGFPAGEANNSNEHQILGDTRKTMCEVVIPVDEICSAGIAASKEDTKAAAPLHVTQNASDTGIRGIVAGEDDVEVTIPATGIQSSSSNAQTSCFCSRTPRRKRCCLVSIACFLSFAVGLGIVVAIFWPRNPEWQLRKLTINDEAALVVFGHAFFETFPDNRTLPNLDLWAEIEFYNPNKLGGEMLIPGLLAINFKGQKLGTVTVHPATFQPHTHAAITANVSVHLTSPLFKQILADVKTNDFKLSVQVQGDIRVQALLGFEIEVAASCDIHMDVVQVMDQAHRHDIVEAKACRYTYF